MRAHFLICAAMVLSSCSPKTQERNATDSAFAGVQERGKAVMGVDQYTSTHVFEDLSDGGRIVLDRDSAADSAAIATIRTHMQDILKDFRAGNFSKPFQVHAMEVPGTDVMRANAAKITYSVVDRPRGAELRMTTADSTVLAAIRKFLEFQRKEHHAGAHEM